MECAGSSMTTLMFIFTTVATTLASTRGEQNHIIEGPIEAVESLRNNQAFDLVKLVDNPLDTDALLSTTLFKRIKRNVENEVNSLFQKAGDNQKYPTQGN
ncbi:unnamed protein product [Timema podura]|uniref:Uncharacterized protein n=1 Tax=Timema podura TaxID=61482 RepID=A0ABN7P847_TIMPD|nr:unnamed protein product [Timema podura]